MIGQGQPPPQHGLQALAGPTGAPAAPSIDPKGSIIQSSGSRMSSIITPITAVMGTGGGSFFWDGTSGSQPLIIRRDDGSKFGPSIVGSPMVVTGLNPSTRYWFYFYFDENAQVIKAADIPGFSVGTPAIAFPAVNLDAAHQQILKGRIQVAPVFSSTGVLTTGAGTATTQGGVGGGGGGWGH